MDDIKVGDFIKWSRPGGHTGEGFVSNIGAFKPLAVAVEVGTYGRKEWVYASDVYFKEYAKTKPTPALDDAPKTPAAHAPDDYHAKKFDGGKSRMDLLPWAALVEVGRVLEYGCRKYAEGSWRDVPDARKRYLAAMFRHAAAIQEGETLDPESGLHHAAHMACNALFVCWLTLKGK